MCNFERYMTDYLDIVNGVVRLVEELNWSIEPLYEIIRVCDIIETSRIHPILKSAIIDRINCCWMPRRVDSDDAYTLEALDKFYKCGSDFVRDVLEDKLLFCDLDSCLYYYETVTGKSWCDSNGDEKSDVDNIVRDAFKSLKGKLDYEICTEDFEPLFEP